LFQQAESGIGFPFHHLRPAGTKCKLTLGSFSDPISFLRIYAEAFKVIQQHGLHGANMVIMRVDIPDIREFINAKSKDGVAENFNFSVELTDDFMERVIRNDLSTW
jgi:ribonucleoside-diphosphate reductase alpha chain